ncbi:MAG: DUF1311 domain-containing protein [Lysobacter sp.]|nr:DUF1311 domain-containing protein [Lysobacter sp.]
MEELSSRSRIPVSELRLLLSDCGRTQLSMNICAFRDFVESDLELDGALEVKRRALPKACGIELGRAQMVWEAERDRECQEETLDAEGGSMRPMLISACKARANKTRIASVKKVWACPLM